MTDPADDNPYAEFGKPKGVKSDDRDPYAGVVGVKTGDKIKSPEGVSLGEAFGAGAVKGVTANFSDELSGILGAAGHAIDHPKTQTMMQDIISAYERGRDEHRAWQKHAEEERPKTHMAGELTGGAAMALVPVGGTEMAATAAATRLGRIGQRVVEGAKAGAGYGAVAGAGEGEGAENRAGSALTGMVGGAVGGAALAPLGATQTALRGAYDYTVKPFINLGRGLVASEREAGRRVTGAIGADRAGGHAGLTEAEYDAARAAGVPVANVDLGGATTLALERSAANTSPAARGTLENMTSSRFETQNVRAAETMRSLGGGQNATKTREQLTEAYNTEKGPAYRTAYSAGDRPLWSPELERLTSAPEVKNAMTDAITKGKNIAVSEGHGGFNPPITVTPDGRMVFNSGPSGIPTYPNLQYWDYVKRGLSDKAAALYRSGQNEEAMTVNGLAKQLRDELDKHVPQYGQARSTAADFFGAKDALQAGEMAVTWKGDPEIVRQQIAKMKPNERDLFKDGFASEMAQKLEAVPDRNDITNRIYSSPQARKMIDAIYGEDGAKTLEAFIRRENIMHNAKKILGGSSTAQQIIEAGLAGGSLGAAYGAFYEGEGIEGVSKRFGEGFSAGSTARLGGRVFNKVAGYVDQQTAHRVAELLASSDRTKLEQGLQIIKNNARLTQAWRNFDNRLAGIVAGQQSAEHAPAARPGPRVAP